MTERQYFALDSDMSLAAKPWYVWENKDEILENWRGEETQPFAGLDLKTVPKFRFDKKSDPRSLRDAYKVFVAMRLVSDRLKELFLEIDPEAFVFAPVEMDYGNFDEPGPQFWLCDMVRLLDCVDESQSDVVYADNVPFKYYLKIKSMVVDEEKAGNAHAFRLKYSPLIQVVDEFFVERMKEERIKGFSFKNMMRN